MIRLLHCVLSGGPWLLVAVGLGACHPADDGAEPIPLVCTWAPWDREVESFLVYEDAKRVEWVNRDLSLPLIEASPGRFVFEADSISVDTGGTVPFVMGLHVVIDRITGEWRGTLPFAPEQEIDLQYEGCTVGRAF